MKTRLFSLLFSAFLIIGCSDNLDNSIVSAPTDNLDKSIVTTPTITESILIPIDSSSEVITFPTFSRIYASKLIDGEIGGEFIIDTTYFNREGRLIEVYARLKFDPGAFVGTRTISMFPNAENLSIRLFPDMTFNNIVKLDYFITGLDLETMGYTQNDHLDFVYFSDNGDIELVENSGSNVHPDQQWIRIYGGKLNHFSRYGWTR